jgi:uncharacterized repeat protein (TIGR01451 family)
MKQKIIICLLAFVAFCSFSTLQAQGWDKTFTSPLSDSTSAYAAVETLDSGFVFLGNSLNINGLDYFLHPLVTKVNKRGDVVWTYNPTTVSTFDSAKIFRIADNSLIILATTFPNWAAGELPSILCIKLNSNGIEQSRKTYLYGSQLRDADITPELDRIIVIATQRGELMQKDSLGVIITGSSLLQLSANGDSLSRRFHRNNYMTKVAFGGDRQIYAVAGKYGSNVNYSVGINKYNLAGDSLWFSPTLSFENAIKRANDGRILVNGYYKLDYDGRVVFNGCPSNSRCSLFSFHFTQRIHDNNIYSFIQFDRQNPSNFSNFYFTKIDSVGRQVLSQRLIKDAVNPQSFSSDYSYFSDVIPTLDGGFLLVGRTEEYTGKARLIKLSFGRDNVLKGKIYIDSIQNCQLNSLEKGFSGRLISAEKANETNWAITNSVGDYEMQIDTGKYTVKGILPNQNWRFCTPSVSKQLSAFGTTDTANFAMQAAFYCPQMRVSASTQGLRRCFANNAYQIRYTNDGTVAAQNAFITLKLDSLLEYVGASRPLSSRAGQTLRFNLGTVPVDFDDQFSVQVRVKCGDSTRIGQSLCTEARIFPDTICFPAPNWSGANIVVSGRCDRDSVRFIIQNTGAAASSSLRRRIVEDELVFLNGNINIPALTSRTIAVPANGKTWRLNMAQEPNNPANDFPTAVVEGCRTSATQPISTGIVNQFATDNGSPTIKNVCSPIVGAYDPNDKEGLPLGYKASRFIEQNQAIDYRIRFQNTGNDTAFTVVLRDTLSEFLDISSIKTGASSHKYTWSIEGQNVLVFRFDNILLVDSFRNVAASQGFVSFKINQKKDVALGSKINNLADIYFDYNAPIRTNKTLHTIGKDFVVSVLEKKSALPNVKINVFPNPFNAEATIDIQGFEKMHPLSILSHFTLFDAVGRQLRNEKFEGNAFTFKRQDLTTGIYFFRIENNGRLIGTGKFLIK